MSSHHHVTGIVVTDTLLVSLFPSGCLLESSVSESDPFQSNEMMMRGEQLKHWNWISLKASLVLSSGHLNMLVFVFGMFVSLFSLFTPVCFSFRFQVRPQGTPHSAAPTPVPVQSNRTFCDDAIQHLCCNY